MSNSMKKYLRESSDVLRELSEDPPGELDDLVEAIFQCWDDDGKVVSCGNGGSATDSQHFTTELVARFDDDEIHKPAISLATNPASLTAISNDWNYSDVFARQVRALLQPEDLLLGISTSGCSENVIKALNHGINIGANCFGLTGETGGDLVSLDCTLITVPSRTTSYIQEAHAACLHYVCHRIDKKLNQ